MKRRSCLVLLVLTTVATRVVAEYTFFTPPGSYAVEVSLENSNYLRLPIYRNAVTSLAIIGDYAIGGTSAEKGSSPFLFAVSLRTRRLEMVTDLAEVVAGQRALISSFGRSDDGALYSGTMPSDTTGSGHLVRVEIKAKKIEVRDLGIPVSGEGVFAIESRGSLIFGISHPSGRFFVHEISGGKTRIFDDTAPDRRTRGILREYALNIEDILSRRLIVDRKGRVFGSMPPNRLFRYDPAKQRIELLPEPIPEVWGRGPLGRVDAWASMPDGGLYGGNAGDGQLFKLDPDSGKVTNLGKPVMMPRIKGLVFAADGKLYGVAGAPPGYSHLFSYDPHGAGYLDLGNPRFTMTEPGIEQGIFWRGFHIGSMAVSEDGQTIVMGEEEALSQLMVFHVEKRSAN